MLHHSCLVNFPGWEKVSHSQGHAIAQQTQTGTQTNNIDKHWHKNLKNKQDLVLIENSDKSEDRLIIQYYWRSKHTNKQVQKHNS